MRERGDVLLMYRIDTTPATSEDLGEVEQAIRDTTALMAKNDADLVTLTQRLQALKETRSKLRATAPSRRSYKLPSEPYSAAWDSTVETEARRTLLLTQLTHVTVQPGSKARNRFDSERVEISWVPTSISIKDGEARPVTWR